MCPVAFEGQHDVLEQLERGDCPAVISLFEVCGVGDLDIVGDVGEA